MKDELFLIDSNILVYAHDTSDIIKNKKSIKLLEDCWNDKNRFAISLQNLSEFYVVVTKKIKNPLEKNEAKKIIKEILEFKNWIKLTAKESTIIKAIELLEKHETNYYDSLIAATMLENGITKIYTENVKDFIRIKEIEVINPFN